MEPTKNISENAESSHYVQDTMALCKDLMDNHPDADIRLVTDKKEYTPIIRAEHLLNRLIQTPNIQEIYAAESGWSILASKVDGKTEWNIESRVQQEIFIFSADHPYKKLLQCFEEEIPNIEKHVDSDDPELIPLSKILRKHANILDVRIRDLEGSIETAENASQNLSSDEQKIDLDSIESDLLLSLSKINHSIKMAKKEEEISSLKMMDFQGSPLSNEYFYDLHELSIALFDLEQDMSNSNSFFAACVKELERLKSFESTQSEEVIFVGNPAESDADEPIIRSQRDVNDFQ